MSVLSSMVTTEHLWLLHTYNAASASTEFFTLILINLNLSNHRCLLATVLDSFGLLYVGQGQTKLNIFKSADKVGSQSVYNTPVIKFCLCPSELEART